MNGIGATATSVSGTLTFSMIAERDDEAHQVEAHDRHEGEEQLHRADVAVGAGDELARLHPVVERERQRGEVLVDRGAQVVLERVGRLEQRRPVVRRSARRAAIARTDSATTYGVRLEVRSVSALSIAPMSTHGARICASIATAAADRPKRELPPTRQQHGQHAPDPPEVAVGRDGRRRGRRAVAVRERRLVGARRTGEVVEVAVERGHWAAGTPFEERVAVDCTPAQLRHHTVGRARAPPPTAAATSPSWSRRSASGARSSRCRAPSSRWSRSRSSPSASSIAAVVLWLIARRRPARPARGARRRGGRVGPAARLRAADDRPPVHELGDVGVHHLPPGRVRADPRVRAPRSATPPGDARRASPSRWSVSSSSPIPAAAGTSSGFGKGELLTLGLRDRLRRPRRDPRRDGPSARPDPPGRRPGDRRGRRLRASRASGSAATASPPPPWPRPSRPRWWPRRWRSCCRCAASRPCPPSRAAVLLLVEPVFAAHPGRASPGDPLAAVQLVGAGLILFAVVLCEVAPEWLDRRVSAREAVPR